MSSETSSLIKSSQYGRGVDRDIQSRIGDIKQKMQAMHDSRENFSYEWRISQLSRLENMVDGHFDEMVEALRQDLGKVRMEAAAFELGALKDELAYLKKHLKHFMQPQDRPSPGLLAPAFSKVTPMPLKGPAVLVIGPSNYPISISLMAVAGSLAAGNPTVLKPSELCPASCKVMAKYVPEYFEPNAFQIVEGSVAETSALLEQEWGLIHFTGSERVGKIVASAAAKTLTPIILELGGKCPCLVDETCPSDIRQVASRIVFGKLVNCGQNCISPDYLLVHKSKLGALQTELLKALEDQFGKEPEKSGLGKLVAESHVKRAIALIEEAEDKAKHDEKIEIICGGSKKCNAKTGYVAPTFILNPPMDSRIMQEEIFSPILSIVVVESREEAVKVINSRPGTPLALYVFTTSDRVFTDLTQRCRSGTAVRNDSVIHFTSPHLPFGGLGTSGIGSYKGESSLQSFSQMLPSLYRPCFPGADMHGVRCQPYVTWKTVSILKMGSKLPDVPVLKTVRRAVILALVAMGITRFVPGIDVWVNAGRLGLADVLQRVVNALRE